MSTFVHRVPICNKFNHSPHLPECYLYRLLLVITFYFHPSCSVFCRYTGILTDPNKSLADIHRDTLLDILSDARVAAPMLQTGLYLAKVNPKCYMYVFAHNSEAGEYGRVSLLWGASCP